MKAAFKRKRESTFLFEGIEFPVNSDKDFLCYEALLEILAGQFKSALEHHSRLVVARFDLTSFDLLENNKRVEELLRRLKQWLFRRYRMHNVAHFWVREACREKGLHWHVVVFLDGNKVRNNFVLNNFVKEWWGVRDYGLFSYPPQKSYHRVERDDMQSIQECFYHASYLAKERSKEYLGSKSCFYGASRLRR